MAKTKNRSFYIYITEIFTDKNISTQANLVNMVLDYSPKTKTTFQFPEKIDLSRLRTKPQSPKKQNRVNFSENSIEMKIEAAPPFRKFLSTWKLQRATLSIPAAAPRSFLRTFPLPRPCPTPLRTEPAKKLKWNFFRIFPSWTM